MKQKLVRRSAAVAALGTCLVGVASPSQAQPSEAPQSLGSVAAQDNPAYMANRVKHVKSAGTKCGKKPIAMASGRGKITLRIDETRSVSTTKSQNIQATYKAISYSVGWDVTKSRSITVSGMKEVPRGKYGTLKAYTKYTGKKFDVYAPTGNLDWVRIQKGKKAWKPIGTCFKYTQR
ncbi:hypothetical protein ACWGII_35270 [Streptomyces sp. NPDC054855]